MVGIGIGLGITRRKSQNIITTPQTIILFGDSITGASSTNSTDNGTSYSVTAATKANPVVITESNGSLTAALGDKCYVWGLGGMTEINNAEYTVTGTPTATTVPLNVNGTAFTTYTSNGKIYRLNNAVISTLAQGFIGPCNALMGQRFTFNHQLNRGIGGNSSADLDSRKARDLAGMGATLAIVMIGTNDVTASVSVATIQSNISSVVTYVTGTLGIKCVLGTLPPRDSDTAGQKDNRETLNTWIRTLGSSNVIVWDYYADVTDGSRNWKTGYAYDGVHPAPLGGYVMARKLRDALLPVYGLGSGFVVQGGNLLTNPTMTGTAGTAGGTLTSSGVADSWTTETSGTGLAATRTVSKSGEGYQRFDIAYGSGLTTGERLSIRQSVASGSLVVGTRYVCEAKIRLNSFSGTGALYETSLELRNNASGFGFDFSRRNNDTLATTEMIADGWLHLKTQPIEFLTGWTELRPRINLTAKCDTGTVSAQLDIAGCQLYAV